MKTKRLKKSTIDSFINYGLVIVFYIVIQTMINGGDLSATMKGQLVPICVYMILAVSLNLVVGISGELSLGHAGFMSVGAFTGVLVSASLIDVVTSGPLRLLIAIVVGGITAAIAGVIIGIPVLRLRGDYLAIVTLAFGEIIKNVMNCIYVGKDVDGLHFGMTSISELHLGEGATTVLNGPMGALGITKIASFTAGILLLLFTLFVLQNMLNSRSGRAIMAIRDNRIAAEATGINIIKYKMMAFVTSASFAGMAGVLYAMNYSTVVAKKFDFNTSILILVFVVLGGLGNLRGSMIAAALLTILPELLREYESYRMLVYAIILILVMLVTNNPKAVAVKNRLIESVTAVFKKKNSKGGAEL